MKGLDEKEEEGKEEVKEEEAKLKKKDEQIEDDASK